MRRHRIGIILCSSILAAALAYGVEAQQPGGQGRGGAPGAGGGSKGEQGDRGSSDARSKDEAAWRAEAARGCTRRRHTAGGCERSKTRPGSMEETGGHLERSHRQASANDARGGGGRRAGTSG